MHAKTVRFVVGFLLLLLVAYSGSVPLAVSAATETDSRDIHAFHLLTTNTGWLWLGQQLYWTANAGANWREITPVARPATPRAVFFLDTRQGWVLMARPGPTGLPLYSLARTTDGGATWQTRALALFRADDPNALGSAAYLHFIDAQTGWLVVRRATSSVFSLGALFKTTDGGDTWTALSIPLGEPVYFVTAQVGWTAGGPAGDELYRTQDGGRTWSSQVVASGSPSTRQRYRLPQFDTASTGVLPVVSTDKSGTQVAFYRTSDGGQSWQPGAVVPVTPDRIADTQVPLATMGADRWLLAVPKRSRLLDVSDRGETRTIAAAAGPQADIVALQMVSTDVGWAKSVSGNCVRTAQATPRCTQKAQLLRTRTGGSDWQTVSLPQPVQSVQSPAGTFIGQGFDNCFAGTADEMQNWFTSSPYRVWNIYLGGVMYFYKCTRVTPGYVSQLAQQGWQFILTWVGPQAPCSGLAVVFSSTPATAYSQGVAEANAAIDAAANLGLTAPDKSGVIIYYDMEAFPSTNYPCRQAAQQFVNGWTAQVHARGNRSGVYALYKVIADYAPFGVDDIWIADWDGVASVWDIPYLDNSLWANNQRLKQYGGGNETWGGVTLNIDNDTIGGEVVTPCYTLSVRSNPSVGGIAAAQTTPNCSGPYFAFSTVLVTAIPNPGYAFFGWGGSATGMDNPITLRMDSSKTLTANFIPLGVHYFIPLVVR